MTVAVKKRTPSCSVEVVARWPAATASPEAFEVDDKTTIEAPHTMAAPLVAYPARAQGEPIL